ncbi:hypothetical protein LTR85_008197 [Meristemomyces frigidus]|nr:hypothetical protein LTR85_008197 [Meristemomyces frigidus]
MVSSPQSLLARVRTSHGSSAGNRRTLLHKSKGIRVTRVAKQVQASPAIQGNSAVQQPYAAPVFPYPDGLTWQQPNILPRGDDNSVKPFSQQELNDFQRARQENFERQDDESDDEDLTSIADDQDFPHKLTINSVEEARQKAYTRVPLNAKNDDWQVVKRSKLRQKQWMVRIMAALHKPYKPRPEARKNGDDRTAEELAEWTRWQETHKLVVDGVLDDEDLEGLDEAAGWRVLGETLDAHRLGCRLSSHSLDATTVFSRRMAKIERVIADVSMVRVDVVENNKLHELAANPEDFMSRKVNNLWVNYRKALREQERQELAKDKLKADARAKGEPWADDEGAASSSGKAESRKKGALGAALKRKIAPKPRGRGKAKPKPKPKLEATEAVLAAEDDAATSEDEEERTDMLADPNSEDLLHRPTKAKNHKHTAAPKSSAVSKRDAESEDGDEQLNDAREEGGGPERKKQRT